MLLEIKLVTTLVRVEGDVPCGRHTPGGCEAAMNSPFPRASGKCDTNTLNSASALRKESDKFVKLKMVFTALLTTAKNANNLTVGC